MNRWGTHVLNPFDDIPHQGSEQGGGAMRGLWGPLLPWTPDEEGSVEECEEEPVKGILPYKNFYRPNSIFWIVMGCGNWKFWCQSLLSGTSRLAAYETSRQAAIGAQGAATWDLEASRNDRKRAESQKPLWHRGITLQEMLQILLAPEKGIVFIWLHMSLDCTVTPRGPREQTLWPKFSILGVFCHLRLKGAIPHPFTIQNEVWEIKDFFVVRSL